MAQQINLYNAALERQREWLTLGSVTFASLAFLLVLAATGAVMKWQTGHMKAEAAQADARLNEKRAQLAKLAASPQAQQAKQELERVQDQLAARREVLAALQAGLGKHEGTAGFADYLRGLARQSVNGLWLTGFSVAQGGDGIEIRGRMTVAEALPEYIRRLNGEKTFQGRQFVSLNVDRPVSREPGKYDPRTPYNSFVLTSTVAAPEGKAVTQ